MENYLKFQDFRHAAVVFIKCYGFFADKYRYLNLSYQKGVPQVAFISFPFSVGELCIFLDLCF